MGRRRSLLLAAVAGMISISAVTGGAGGAPADWTASASTAQVANPAQPSSNPPGLVPTPCTGPVPVRARCATLWVPLDYADPALGTIPTAVVIVPALEAGQRLGSLLLNPGGPGESGVQFVDDQYAEFADLNQRFDLVGFDPRGTTGPDAVSCEGTTGLDHEVGVDPKAFRDPAREADMVATSLAFADACRLHSGAILGHVSTQDAARDLDALRAALGDDKLTYLGFSYGTYLGAVYASLFPTHIRAMVLDGDIDPSLDFLDLSLQQGASFEVSYREFVRRCAPAAACPLGANPGTTISDLLARLAVDPMTAADGRSVGRGLALTALVAAMYVPSDWGVFYAAFAQAAHGDPTGLESLADALTGRGPDGYDHSMEANAAINCADHAVPESLATYDAEAAGAALSEPHFGEDEVYSLLTCAFWTVHGPPAAPLHVTAAPPILLVGATDDPATPYAWSQSLSRQIKLSVLLTRVGYGHTSYEFSGCVRAAVDTYLESLRMPAAGTVCPTD